MEIVDGLIQTLIAKKRYATNEEVQQIIEHIAQRPLATYLIKMTLWLRQALATRGVAVPATKLPSAQIHLLKRIYYDGQWPAGTTISQFETELHRAAHHEAVQLWTYRWVNEHFAGLLAPSHVRNVPEPEDFIFVAYSADYGTIKTGFQASGVHTIFTEDFEHLVRHR